MDLEALYKQVGGSAGEVLKRIPSEKMLRKFVGKYLADPTFGNLESAAAVQDWKGAFLAAHTLKGVCANLSFTRLCASASALTEALRPQGEVLPAQALPLLEEVRRDYRITVDAIRRYLGAA